MEQPTEIKIGPFVFEWDEKRNEMYVSTEEEHIATAEQVWPKLWQEFVTESGEWTKRQLSLLDET